MSINEQIKTYLIEHGIKQSFVADKAGLSYVKLSRVLNNEAKLTALEYCRICAALEVPLNTFVEGE